MKLGIITTQTRPDYLAQTLKSAYKEFDEIIIFNDIDKKGHMFNQKRLYLKMQEICKEGELFMTMSDDVELSTSWKSKFETIEAKNRDIDVFVLAYSREVKDTLVKGYKRGKMLDLMYDHCMIWRNKKGVFEELNEWQEKHGADFHKCNTHYDVCVQSWWVKIKNKEYVVATPPLADHIGEVSTLGHKCKTHNKYYVRNSD